MPTKQIYEFGEFRIDADERLLLRDGKPVPLTPKAFETLLALVENSGHVIKKDDLMKRVWPDAIVEEVNLAKNVSTLRQAIEGNGQQYIETVPKLGYRLIVKARIIGELQPEPITDQRAAAAGPSVAPIEATTKRAVPELTAKAKKGVIVIGLAVVALVGLAVGVWLLRQKLAEARPIRSLVILPLTNLSGDASQEYFVDGITEELTTELAKLAKAEPLRVISRTTAMRYKNTAHAVPEIGRELHVDAVLEGAVMRSGDRVRITAQLIRAADDEHIWAQSYDRDLIDALTVQGEIAQDIAKQIKLQISPVEQARRLRRATPSAEAQDAYLRGRYEWNKRSHPSLLKARTLFQQAIDKEPSYALAWAGLADTEYLITANALLMPPSEGMPRSKAAAQRALELDDSLGEAHMSLAMVTYAYDRNWPAAEREYRRGLQLSPNYATGHQFYGIGLSSQGRFEEAISEERRAVELDPLSQIINANLARILYYARRYDEAAAVCREAIAVDPNYALNHQMLALVLLEQGHKDEALKEVLAARQLSPDFTGPLVTLVAAYARSGKKKEALAAIQELRQMAQERGGYMAPHYFAMAYAELGQMDLAFRWLDKAIDEERSPFMMLLNVTPEFDALRGDPRFDAEVKRMVPR